MQTGLVPISTIASLIYPLTSILDRVDPGRLFPKSQPLEIELGSGDGSFLVEYASQTPQRNFIGVERLLGRIRKLDKKGRRAGLVNLIGIRIESSYFLKYMLPPHSASALHVYFPDPWPKRKHRRHRLINEQFPEIARQALVHGGRVYLRTDDGDYFAQMITVFGSNSSFARIEPPSELTRLRTDFEVEFNAGGIVTLSIGYEAK